MAAMHLLTKKVWACSLLIMSAGVLTLTAGCVQADDGVVWFREAPLAEGWPTLTPVGQIEVKDYPEVRVAVVEDNPADEKTENMNSMFGQLFNHIKKNEVAMTTPVEMGYADDQTHEMKSMAFLYRRTDQGEVGEDGTVTVKDQPGRTYASIGVRGSYTDERFAKQLALLDAWLEEHAGSWQADGPPRYLGYNSPFIPGFWRYGEVQRPVKPVEE